MATMGEECRPNSALKFISDLPKHSPDVNMVKTFHFMMDTAESMTASSPELHDLEKQTAVSMPELLPRVFL